MTIRKHIPNTITLGNLLCGCMAIVKIFEHDLASAAYLVGIALILDFFDGFTARLLKVSSPIGKDLDSLADMVTFGVVPGFMLFFLIRSCLPLSEGLTQSQVTGGTFTMLAETTIHEYWYMAYVGFLVPVFSALRLAKFNNDPRQSDSFIGLPTPANAIFICSLAFILSAEDEQYHSSYAHLLSVNAPFLLPVTGIVLCLLLTSEIRLFALKFRNFGWAGNELRFIFLAISVLVIVAFQFMAIPVVILLYILLSIVNNMLTRKSV